MKKLFFRVRIEIFIMAVIALLLFVVGMADTSPMGLALFLYKVLLFSASQVHAIIVRKVFFPYIDFKEGKPMHQAIVIAIHLGAAYLYAAGG